MKARLRKTLCLLLALCLLAGSIAFADGSDQRTDLRVYLDGLLRGRAYLDNGKIYLSMESVSDFYSLGISAVFKDGELYFTGPNFDMYVNSDVGYTRVNGRYLYTPDGYFRSGGQIYLPLEVLARIFGFEYSVPEDDQPRVELQRGELNVLQGGDNYYDINFVSEDIFWLSRIIRAEAQNEPLSCMIGVGNVVLTRVASGNGTVYADPTEEAIIATYLVLEGYNTVGGSMYFLNPQLADDTWFRTDLQFCCTLGLMDFYQ